MNKYYSFIGAAVACLIATGCRTNIATLPITERDQQTYNNKYAKEYLANQAKNQAIRVAIVPQNSNLQGKDKRMLQSLKSLTNTFGDGLETAFSNLSDFEVAPRTELGAILDEKALVEMSSGKNVKHEVENVNFMVVYRISSYNFKQFKPLFAKKKAKPQFRAYVKVKISLINLQENVKEFTKTVTGTSSDSSPSATIGLLNQAVENAVKNFSSQFAVEYAPPALVEQTKGSGKVALLNVGKDFGLMKNMKVEFFFFKEKNGKRRVIPFAYGKVIELGEDSAWVQVDDFETAGVKENHFARVRKDQSRTFLDVIK
jgi:curli biogenesis system outer membrane secretion channel CsgG